MLRPQNLCVDKMVQRRTKRATTVGPSAPSFASPARLPSISSIEDGVSLQADREAKQAQALEALFKSSRSQRPLDELAQAFLRPIISREGASFFSFGLIAQAVEAVTSSGLADAGGDAALPPGSPERCEVSEHFVSVVRWLSESTSVPFTEIAGQILWRNRRSKVLQRQPFRRLTRDFGCWMGTSEGPLEPVEQVFRCLTADTGRRMGFRQFQKVICLIQKNPILQSRIKLSDADRLFYGQCRSGGQAHKDIGMSDYKDLLFELAEASGIHPCLILMSVGSHARRLSGEVDKEEAVAPARSLGVLRRSERLKTAPPGGSVQAARPLQ